MVEELLELLAPAISGPGGADPVLVDGTVGAGGHAEAALERFPRLLVVGVDRDPEILDLARRRLGPYSGRIRLVEGNFRELPSLLAACGVAEVMGVVLDLGVSSLQLDRPARGFGYGVPDAPLDMRMGPDAPQDAATLVNTASQRELTRIIGQYGEERWASRISAFIVRTRQRRPLRTAADLVEVIDAAIPAAARRRGGHPARRTFQALRIEVNDELGALSQGLPRAAGLLAEGGRMIAISFHSLDDRVVKRGFAELARQGGFEVLTKKPLVPAAAEVARNPRVRSAKLRALERTPGRTPVLGAGGGEYNC
jgi:16S rRNA (cytosine1402-N4)-methyltransferase